MPQWICIAAYLDLPSAWIAKGKLEAFAIPCRVDDEHLVRMDWFYTAALGGIRIRVPQDRVAEAAALLGDDAFPLYPAQAQSPASARTRRCPACGGTRFTRKRDGFRLWVIPFILSQLPLPLYRLRYACAQCGRVWDEEALYADDQSDSSDLAV